MGAIMKKCLCMGWGITLAIGMLAMIGCTSKSGEDADKTKQLPPPPTPNASIPDKYPGGMMPGGGPGK
jgi:hypothetical protein